MFLRIVFLHASFSKTEQVIRLLVGYVSRACNLIEKSAYLDSELILENFFRNKICCYEVICFFSLGVHFRTLFFLFSS